MPVKGRGLALLKALAEREQQSSSVGLTEDPNPPTEIEPRGYESAPDQGLTAVKKAGERRLPRTDAGARAQPRPLETIREDFEPLLKDANERSLKLLAANERKLRGDVGKKIQLTVNYISLERKETGSFFYEYRLNFDDKTDTFLQRLKSLESLPEYHKDSAFFNGSVLVLPKKLELTEINLDEGKYVKFPSVEEIGLNDKRCLKIFNMILNKSFAAMNLYPVRRTGSKTGQRSFFDPSKKETLPADKLEIWPGYITSLKQNDKGVFLAFDSCSKIIRQETVSNVISNLLTSRTSDYVSLCQKELIGKTVITRYNNRTYKILEVSFEKCPENKFPYKEREITYIEYFQEVYGLKIQDTKQPLLVVDRKEVDGNEFFIMLVPELCYMCGLTENQRNDFKVMKRVADYTRLKPTIRHEYFQTFIKSLKANEKAMQIWNAWGLKFSSEALQLEGRILPPPTLFFGQNYEERINRAEWSRPAANKQMLAPIALEKWAIVYNKKTAEQAFRNFKDGIRECAKKIGVPLKPPKTIEIYDDRTDSLIKNLREIPKDCELVLAIFSGPMRTDKYSALKKICCIEKPMPSQVILQKTLTKSKNIQSVLSKVLLQMATKGGGEPWGVKIPPLPGLMVMSIHEAKSFTTLVSTVNDTFSRFSSLVWDHKIKEGSVRSLFNKAIEAYKSNNGNENPKSVIIFSNGAVKSEWKEDFPDETDVALIMVKTNTILKMMQLTDWRKGEYANPPAGTVVDHKVTSENDFYLVPMNVNLGTVTPTHFVVVDQGSFEANHIQEVAYALTHMYFNWTGTVKVPATSQYALKLSDLVTQHLHSAPDQSLSSTLFYL